MILSRRRLFAGAPALLAAPAIIRVASLMPVSTLLSDGLRIKAYERYASAVDDAWLLRFDEDFRTDRLVVYGWLRRTEAMDAWYGTHGV